MGKTTKRIAVAGLVALVLAQTGCNGTMMGVGGAVAGAMLVGGVVATTTRDAPSGACCGSGGEAAIVGGVAIGVLTLIGGVIGEAAGMNDAPAKPERRRAPVARWP